jgi:GWxTD domain-containing protein
LSVRSPEDAQLPRIARALVPLLVPLALCLAGGAGNAASRSVRAESLYRRALAHLTRNTLDARRLAIDELERATLLAPGTAEYELTLARTYYQAGFMRHARERFVRVTRLAPSDADSRYGLGQVWRHDWLKYLETASLQRAVENLREAVRLAPSSCDAWLLLVPLLQEQGNPAAAAAAAWHAREADPERPEALIADAYTSYHLGRLDHADSAFAAGIPRLRRSVRERFEDIAPVATERDTFELHRLSPEGQADFVRRFWKENDPDLATARSEAQLEYWSRVSHAFFLYFDPRRGEWDERGELYVRYGPPSLADYNPLSEKLYTTTGFGRAIPANILVWNYQPLGMRVVLQDRLLSEYFLLPVDLFESTDPRPDPDSLARLGAQVTSGGRGVFPMLPPGTRPRPVDGVLSRFEASGRPLLRVGLEAAGPPDDSLWAECVVLDSARVEVRRERATLVPSACDPAAAQVADFTAECPPGKYLVGVTVRDRYGRRGVYRAPVELPAPPALLSLSDVVISCGLPFTGAPPEAAPAVRPEPNPNARVRGSDPLTAYFEIYHLQTGADGRARFEYVYAVRSAERDRRIWLQRVFQPRAPLPSISATRAEEQVGDLRRQFVRVPVQSLPAGRYRLEIAVRDLLAGSESKRVAEFVRVAEPPPGN